MHEQRDRDRRGQRCNSNQYMFSLQRHFFILRSAQLRVVKKNLPP
jgi:hypothetical protein